jgi:hypothetical protein
MAHMNYNKRYVNYICISTVWCRSLSTCRHVNLFVLCVLSVRTFCGCRDVFSKTIHWIWWCLDCMHDQVWGGRMWFLLVSTAWQVALTVGPRVDIAHFCVWRYVFLICTRSQSLDTQAQYSYGKRSHKSKFVITIDNLTLWHKDVEFAYNLLRVQNISIPSLHSTAHCFCADLLPWFLHHHHISSLGPTRLYLPRISTSFRGLLSHFLKGTVGTWFMYLPHFSCIYLCV